MLMKSGITFLLNPSLVAKFKSGFVFYFYYPEKYAFIHSRNFVLAAAESKATEFGRPIEAGWLPPEGVNSAAASGTLMSTASDAKVSTGVDLERVMRSVSFSA